MRQRIFWAIVIAATLLGSLAITATIVWQWPNSEIKRELVRAFGDALLIAGFIAATVDQYVKRRLLWET